MTFTHSKKKIETARSLIMYVSKAFKSIDELAHLHVVKLNELDFNQLKGHSIGVCDVFFNCIPELTNILSQG